jgi:AAA family ATP:ADP antiporter
MKGAFFTFLQKVFDIREGEFSRALLMQLNFFLIIATLLIVKPTVNGLFLAEMGANRLPSAYLLVAFFAILVSSIYARILGRVNLNKIILGTLLLSVGLFVLFGILLRLNIVVGWILYAFYIVMAIFAVLSASQFWVLANVIFNAREAKRIFGFIGAGAIGGGILGGYLTSLLAEPLGSENLIFVAAGLLFLCVPNTSYMWNNFVVTSQSKYQRRKKIPKIEHPFFLIRKSAHLTNLSGIIAISVIVAKLVDYQFGAITSSIITDPDELTAFFGFWFSNFNVISLIIQLILTRRIVKKLGIGGSLFLLPASIFLGASLVLFIPALWTAIFLKSSDASLKQSLNRATFELLAVPIPSEIKNQTKIFIDVVVDSLATGVGGIILIFVINALNLSTGFISVIILALLGLWFLFGRRVRQTYLDAFRVNLKNLPEEEVLAINLEDEAVVTDLKYALRNGSDRQTLSVLKKLRIQPDHRFIEELEKLLSHPSFAVQEEAIRNLYSISNIDLSRKIIPFIRSESQPVQVAAFSYLIAKARRGAPAFIKRYLEVEDHKITIPLLISMAEESRDNPVLKSNFLLVSRLDAEFTQLSARTPDQIRKYYALGLLKAAGLAKKPILFPRIERFFVDPDPEIRTQAILAAGETLDPYFVPALIELLGESLSAEAATRALVNYGNEIIPAIIRYMKPARVSLDIIRNIPGVIGHFPVQFAVDFLLTLALDPDERTSHAALNALIKIKKERSSLNFYKKRCRQYFGDKVQIFQSCIIAEFAIRTSLGHHASDYEKSNGDLLSIQVGKLLHPYKRRLLVASLQWLLLMAKPKNQPSMVVNDKDVLVQIGQLPDSPEKRTMLWMAAISEKDLPSSEDLMGLDPNQPPDLEKSISFVRQLGDPGIHLAREIKTYFGVGI